MKTRSWLKAKFQGTEQRKPTLHRPEGGTLERKAAVNCSRAQKLSNSPPRSRKLSRKWQRALTGPAAAILPDSRTATTGWQLSPLQNSWPRRAQQKTRSMTHFASQTPTGSRKITWALPSTWMRTAKISVEWIQKNFWIMITLARTGSAKSQI